MVRIVPGGSAVVAGVDAPSNLVLIEMKQPQKFFIKGKYNPWIRPGYNLYFVANKAIFEIYNFSRNKAGLYRVMFTIPVNSTHADSKCIYLEVIEECSITMDGSSIKTLLGIFISFTAVLHILFFCQIYRNIFCITNTFP